MAVTAIILSGGRGLRFGADLPKQYRKIDDLPVLGHTLRAFEHSRVGQILIVAAAQYLDLCSSIARDAGCRKLLSVIEGGAERYDSVWNGLQYLHRLQPAGQKEGTDMVLIHDGARPCIRPEAIDRLIEETVVSGAAIAGTPCTDTIKITDDAGHIVSTTARRNTWAAQTPQAFYFHPIYEAYRQVIGREDAPDREGSASGTDHLQITDDAMVYQLAFPDRQVQMVDAGPSNIKITNAEDLDRAAQILRQNTKPQR